MGLGLPVRFHGILDHQPLAGILRRAHVLVIPSQYEGFGIAYLEGMAHGLPALGTRVGALPELIADGVDGYLSSPGEVAALSGQISRLASDRRLLARMGRAALEKYRTRPTWDAVTNQTSEFLAEAVERWSARAQA
jgi:glycosyltransferase involved in cell wall biosynthesis